MSRQLIDAVQHIRAGRVPAAYAALRGQLGANPHDPAALMLFSAAALAAREPRRARDLAHRAARLAPADPRAQAALATALTACGETVGAITAWRRVLARDPGAAVAHANLGQLLLTQGAAAEAHDACDRALALDPALPAALLHRGLAALALGRTDVSEADLRAAQDQLPNDAAASIGLGDALRQAGRHAEAVAALERAVALDPRDAGAQVLLGQALRALGRHDAAIVAFDRALALDSGRHAARWQRAVTRLLDGRLSAAWEDFEARWDLPGMPPRPMLAGTGWWGEELRGRTILVTAEQGLGDAIQFARYVPLLAARGARVVLETRPALLGLFQGLKGVHALLPACAAPPRFDCHCPLLSLPRGFATALETVPAEAAVPVRRTGPRGALAGPNWAGSEAGGGRGVGGQSVARQRPQPVDAGGGARTAGRPAGPEAFQPAMRQTRRRTARRDRPGARAGRLHRNGGGDHGARPGGHSRYGGGAPGGRPGAKVWILLAHEPDWRWMTGRADSPWYPSARLFRQHRPGDWSGVLARVAAALPALVRA